VSDLERVMKHYASDQDAGHEEPWDAITDAMKALYPQHPAWTDWQQTLWGAERALYSRQLQDANKRIHELEKNLAEANGYIIKNGERISELYAENQKLREQLKAFTAGSTVSVPLSAWNKLCAEAAKARPLAEDEPEAFPARALRWSV
jgi:DNA repair exonuclease SbcCD ATPase subunit